MGVASAEELFELCSIVGSIVTGVVCTGSSGDIDVGAK